MKEETILTLHPQGKKGVNILKRRYDMAKEALLEVLQEHKELGAMDLYRKTAEHLGDRLDGDAGWYAVSVKLDLEAKGVLETVRGKGVQKVRIKSC